MSKKKLAKSTEEFDRRFDEGEDYSPWKEGAHLSRQHFCGTLRA